MRPIWWSIVCVALLLFGTLPLSAAEPAKRPNVVMIVIDDLNDWIGALGGSPQSKTPNIDRLVQKGVLFRNAHCVAPACNPSRAALLTGVRPSTSGVYHNDQPWRQPLAHAVTLPRHFKDHGYEVHGGGKIFHGGYDDPDSWHKYFKMPGSPKPKAEVLADPHSQAGGIVWGRLERGDEEMSDDKVVSDAIEFLGAKHDQPFFLACGLYKPHMPWQVPSKYYDQYPLESITLPNVPSDDLSDVPAAGRKMAAPQGDHAKILATDNWKHAVQGYLAAIAFTDHEVGRLLTAIDAHPSREETIVIFWSDHGWHLGEKQHWRKFSLWEEATRAPLAIYAPGMTKAGSACDRAVDFVDIYPTLCELCQLPLPKQLEGESLIPLLKDPAAAREKPALTTHGRKNHAVRSDRYRYIRYADGSEELYDHEVDPQEWKNLAGDEAQQGIKQELARWLPKVDQEDAPRAADKAGKQKKAGKTKEEPATAASPEAAQ